MTVDVLKDHPEISAIADPVEKAETIALYERSAKAGHFTTKYSNLMALCSLPLNALIFWLFYIRARFNYVEHLVGGMYMLGFCILVYALLLLPSAYLFHYSKNYAVLAFFVLQLVYFSVFYHRFMDRSTGKRLLKAFGVTAFALMTWIVFSGGLIRYYIATGFGGLLP